MILIKYCIVIKNNVYLLRVLLLPVNSASHTTTTRNVHLQSVSVMVAGLHIDIRFLRSVISRAEAIRHKGIVLCHHSYSCSSPSRSLCALLSSRYIVRPRIEPGIRDGTNTMIASDLSKGDRIMQIHAEGTYFQDGEHVRIKRTRETGRVNATGGGVVYGFMDQTHGIRLYSLLFKTTP